jgi:AraC-like DNA-binding protein
MPATAPFAVTAGAPPVRSISTDGVRGSERREFWKASTASICGAHEVEILGNQPISAGLEHAEISDLVFSRLKCRTPHRVLRTKLSVRKDDRYFVKAVLLTAGNCVLEQHGSTTCLQAGEWSVYDNAQPYRMTIPNRAEMFLVLMPRERFVIRNFDQLVARRFSGRRGLGKLIWSLVSDTFDQIPELLNRSSEDVAEIVIQMASLALNDYSGERSCMDSKAALRERVKLYIKGHLADTQLSITRLAAVAGCTKRYLHMIFQPEEVSISDYILKLRLERCRQDLLNPVCSHRSITDIAYSWGFNSSNHFSRCYKQAFGTPPRDSRMAFGPWTAGISNKRPNL